MFLDVPPATRGRMRWWLGGFVALLVLAFALTAIDRLAAASAPEEAEQAQPQPQPFADLPRDFDPYIYRTSGGRADPVNLIFRAPDADSAAAAVQQVLGWQTVNGGQMTFRHPDGERPTGRQFGLAVSETSRLHLRIETLTSNAGQQYVLAAVHRDDPAPCGHVGRAFDETRDQVAQAFAAAGYRTARVDLGNRDSGAHCDASHVPGDGQAVVIDLIGDQPGR